MSFVFWHCQEQAPIKKNKKKKMEDSSSSMTSAKETLVFGLVVGALGFVGVIISLCWCWCKKKDLREYQMRDNTWSITMILQSEAQVTRKEEEARENSFSSFSSWFESNASHRTPKEHLGESNYRQIDSPISLESTRRICLTDLSGKDSYCSNLFQTNFYDEDILWNTNRSSSIYEPLYDSTTTRRGWQNQQCQTMMNSFVSCSGNSLFGSFHVDRERNRLHEEEEEKQLVRRRIPKVDTETNISLLEATNGDCNCAVIDDIPMLEDNGIYDSDDKY